MKQVFKRGILVMALVVSLVISAFAENITTSSGNVLGTCTIVSSEVKYDSRGGEVIWVKVKVKNNTGNRIRGTVYGNNGGSMSFILDPYESHVGYLDNCKEIPTALICNNAR